MNPAKLATVTLGLGLALLLVSEVTALKALAVILIFAGLVSGVVAIATPDFVAGDRDEPEPGSEQPPS